VDKGIYMASESSFYRVLHEHAQVQHRGKTQQHKKLAAPDSFTATGPNQVWSRHITYCSSRVRGQYYYMYLIEDIFSRKIVRWEVYDEESGELAAELLQRTVLREQCFQRPLVLHSQSRPRVSNDNPFSEALFKTLKTSPKWPSDGFEDLTSTWE
jgi:putative transposase